MNQSFSDSFDDSIDFSASGSEFPLDSSRDLDSHRTDQQDNESVAESFRAPGFSWSSLDGSDPVSLKRGSLLFTSVRPLLAFACSSDHFFVAGLETRQIQVFSSHSMQLDRTITPAFQYPLPNSSSSSFSSSQFSKSRKSFDITALAVSSNGSYIAVGTRTGEIYLISLTSGDVVDSHSSHTGQVTKICLVSDPSSYDSTALPLIYSVSYDGYFLVYSPQSHQIMHSFITSTCPVTSLLVHPTMSHMVFLGSFDGSIRKLNLQERKCIFLIKSHPKKESAIRNMVMLPSPAGGKKKGGKKKGDASALASPTAKTQENSKPSSSAGARTGSAAFSAASLNSGVSSNLSSSEFSDEHVLLFISHGVGELKVFDTRSGQFLADLNNLSSEVCAATLVASGINRVFLGDDAGSIRVFNRESMTLLDSLIGAAPALSYNEMADTPEMAESHGRGGPIIALHAIPTSGSLISVSMGGDIRAFNLDALEQSISDQLQRIEESKNAAFEQFMASKQKAKTKGKGKGKKGAKAKKGSDIPNSEQQQSQPQAQPAAPQETAQPPMQVAVN